LLLQALKDLKAENDSQQTQIRQLLLEVDTLKTRLEAGKKSRQTAP
jgi:hypothetical protein